MLSGLAVVGWMAALTKQQNVDLIILGIRPQRLRQQAIHFGSLLNSSMIFCEGHRDSISLRHQRHY